MWKYAYQVALNRAVSVHSGPSQIHVLPLLYCVDDFVISNSPLAHLSTIYCTYSASADDLGHDGLRPEQEYLLHDKYIHRY